jgi:mannose/fructose/N-acetylgalactosamine-specific phosphotransferase system component IID
MAKENKSFDSMLIGVISGLIVPLIAVYFVFLLHSHGAGSFEIYMKNVIKQQVLPKVISLSLLGNLLVFFPFIWTNRNKSARGVILAVMIYGIIILALKYL